MSEHLIWVCLLSVTLTLITLIEAIRDYRAIIRRKREKSLRDVAMHAIVTEAIRVLKITALAVGVYLAFKSTVTPLPPIAQARNWIMTGVATAMGLTSLNELAFRHRMLKRYKIEFMKPPEQHR